MRILLTMVLGTLISSSSYASSSTLEVWQHHIEAWGNRNLDAIVSDYDDDSLMIVNNSIFRGQSEIREVFSNLFKIFDEGKNRIDPVVIDGRIVYIVWYFTSQSDKEFFGTDTFLIEDGKIKVQTIASPLYENYPVK